MLFRSVYSQTGAVYPIFSANQMDLIAQSQSSVIFVRLSYAELTDTVISLLKKDDRIVILLGAIHQNKVGEMRAFFHTLLNYNVLSPVVLYGNYAVRDLQELQIRAAADFGALLLDGFGDGIMLELQKDKSPKLLISVEELNAVAFGILQASRVRVSKTEFISCPSCGRTMFNLQTVIARVKASTSHLKGLKIAIMGCIVNGPGEMADADYGYVGAGRGKEIGRASCRERV